MLEARLLNRLWERVITLEVLSGRLHAPDFTRTADDYFAVNWGWDQWDSLDPVKDAEADALLIASGIISRQQAVEARGRDFEDVNAEIIRSRGHLWLASQPDTVVAWEFAGGGLAMGSLGRWLVALPDPQWDHVCDQRRLAAALDWDPPYARFAPWADWRTIRANLAHIANGEIHLYARRIGHTPASAPADARGDWRVFLPRSRTESAAFLESVARSSDRLRLSHVSGEDWSVRKSLRRMVAQAFDHFAELHPKEENDPAWVWRSTIRAKACDAMRGLLPVAKALGCSWSATATTGIGRPARCRNRSTIRYSSGASCSVTTRARYIASTMRSEKKYMMKFMSDPSTRAMIRPCWPAIALPAMRNRAMSPAINMSVLTLCTAFLLVVNK